MQNDRIEPSKGRKRQIRRTKYGPLKPRRVKDSPLFSAKGRSKRKVPASTAHTSDHESH